MQILFAAPFLLLAAVLFTFLSAFGNLRRFAITVPAGILAFGLGGVAGVMVATHFGESSAGHAAHTQASSTAGLYRAEAGFGLGGLIAAIAASLLIGFLQNYMTTINISLAGLVGLQLGPHAPLYELLHQPLSQLASIMPYFLMILILVIRPKGLMGRVEI